MENQQVVIRQVGSAEPVEERITLPVAAPSNEGKTIAAWTLTWVCAIGVLIIGIGMVIDNVTIMWVGGGVTVLGVVASAIMRAAGLGQPHSRTAGERTP